MADQVTNDLRVVTRYALGYEKEKDYSIAPGQLPQTIALEKSIRGTISIFPDLKNPKQYLQDQKAIEQGLKGTTFNETYSNFKNNLELQRLERRFRPMTAPTAPPGGTVDPKLMREFQKSQHYDRVRQLINEAKSLKGTDYTNKLKEIYQEIANADLRVHQEMTSGALKPTTKRGKIWNGIKKYTGINAGQEAVKKGVAKSATLRSISKFARNNAVAAASIDVAIAIPEIMQTKAFFDQIDEDGNYIEDQFDENGNLIQKGSGKEKCGTEKALKQTGRVLAVSGTQIGAFALGAKLGTMAFAAAWAAKGAALGSIAPGLGTVIGGIVGFAVGLGASYIAGITAQKVVGKSELDQFQDKQVDKYTQLALGDTNTLAEITHVAAARSMKETQDNGGQDTERTAEVKASLENVFQAYNNNQIGSPEDLKPDETPQTNTPTTHSGQQPAETQSEKADGTTPSSSTTTQKPQNTQTSTSTPTDATSKTQNPTATATATDTDTDTEPKKDDKKAKESINVTIAKLDIFIKFLENINTPCSYAGGYSMGTNPYIMPSGMNPGFMSIA